MIDRRALLSFTIPSICIPGLALAQTPLAPAIGIPSEKAVFLMAAFRQHAIDTAPASNPPGAAILPPKNVVPFGDWDWFYVSGGSGWWTPNPGQSYKPVEVPVGFVTDLASVPSILWIKYPAQGRYAIAAVIHDCLYWTQTRPRAEADDIFYIAMEDSDVSATTRNAFWAAVRSPAGQSAWDANSRLKAAGEKRFLKVPPPDIMVRWADWKVRPGVFKD